MGSFISSIHDRIGKVRIPGSYSTGASSIEYELALA